MTEKLYGYEPKEIEVRRVRDIRLAREWGEIELITSERGVCIKPQGVNYDKARQDYEEGKTIYYLFEVGDKRGYARFVDREGLYLDYTSPWNESPNTLPALSETIGEFYVPESNTPENLKSSCELVEHSIQGIGDEIRQRVYLTNHSTRFYKI